MDHQFQLNVADSALLLIDIQEKLLPKIVNSECVVLNAEFMVKVAKALNIPVFATEQYPKGLGPTAELLRTHLVSISEKRTFSAVREGKVLAALKSDARIKVIIVGIEAHICVLQTVIDLLNQGFHLFVCVDAVSSRYAIDVEIALRRMQQAGAILTTVEACAYEMLETADHVAFNEVNRLVQERMRQLGPDGKALLNK